MYNMVTEFISEKDFMFHVFQASDLKTGEIVEAVGFRDSTHFLKYFKKITGKNTRDFRQ